MKLLKWLLGYRTCSVCDEMKKDVKPICIRIYDERERVGWLCFDCYIKNKGRFIYHA